MMMKLGRHPAAPPTPAMVFYGSEVVAIAAIALTVASTAYAAYSASQAADAQASAQRYNQQVAEQNAQIAKDQANTQAAIDKQETTRRLGQISASYGASGVQTDQGSPLDVLSDQAATGEMTKQLDLYRGKVAAAGFSSQAQLYGLEAAQTQQAGDIRAGQTILTGAQSAFRQSQSITF